MTRVTIHAAKTHLPRLLARVEAGEEILIVRGQGKEPVAAPRHRRPRAGGVRERRVGVGNRDQDTPRQVGVLVAQALRRGLVLVANEAASDRHGVTRL